MSAGQDKRKIFWGWYVVTGAFLLMAVSYGARYSFGIFVQPLSAENGWSRSVVSLAASINLLVYALGGIGSGRLLDRIAPRWVATTAGIVGLVVVCNASRGVPLSLLVLSATAAIVYFLTQHTPFGRYLYAIGGNEEAAALSGIAVNRVLVGA